MRWTLLLLPLLLLTTAPRGSRAGPRQERVPLFRLIPGRPWGRDGSNATGSPCEGLPAAGSAAVTLTNRSLERLPSCLPRTVRRLDGSHNLLRALSARDLGHLPQLRELTLRHNRVSALSWGPGAPAGLHTLDLSYNLLAALPPCAGSAPRSLRALALAGNPLQALRPGAFACFPALQLLNLSATALGRGAQGGIAPAAFAQADGGPLATLEVLDLSGTLLERVESGWIRDLPKLASLYLRKMPRLRVLEGDIFKMTPNLRQLDCQDSPALTSVHTRIFQDTPCLQVLLFQNCNLSSFPPWTMNSSQVLSINLLGNPLTCSCELAWLLGDTNRTVLSRAADTVCAPAVGSRGPFSAPLSLSLLPRVCRPDQSTTLLASNPPSFSHSAYTRSTRSPGIQQSLVPSAPPAGGPQSITGAPAHTGVTLTQAAWTGGDARQAPTLSSTKSTAGYSDFSVPPKAASTAAAPRGGEPATRLVLAPGISAATTPPARTRRDPSPTSRNPTSKPRADQRTQATAQAPSPSPSQGGIPVLLLDGDGEEEGTEGGGSRRALSCDYHPCKHLQPPCAELQKRSGCSCPGLSGEDAIPDPPKLRGVSELRDTSALIHWCAPNSVVRGYQIRYSAEGGAANQSVVADIYATARQHPLYQLSPGTTYHVCVLATNRAGVSLLQTSSWRRACATFTTKPSSAGLLAGLCAASGLLLVSTVVLAVCLYRQGRRARRQPCDTHLVAFKHPAGRATRWKSAGLADARPWVPSLAPRPNNRNHQTPAFDYPRSPRPSVSPASFLQ